MTSNLRPQTLTRPRPTSTCPEPVATWDDRSCLDFYRSPRNPDGWDVRAEGGDPFFPEGNAAQRRELVSIARAMCAACPVAELCAQARTRRRDNQGVWAGREYEVVAGSRNATLRPEEKRAGRKLQPIQHGTPGGWAQHLRRGERDCTACWDAHREAKRTRAREREQARRSDPQPDLVSSLRPIKHGTPTGYNAHRRRGQDACDECLDAMRDHARTRRAKADAA